MSILDDLHSIMEEEMQKQFKKPNWVMRDISWITEDLFKQMVDIIGEDNILIISGTNRSETKNGVTTRIVRCSCLISPEGIENIKNCPMV